MGRIKCGKPAVVFIAWAGKKVPCCEHHAKGIMALGRAMGSPVEGVDNKDPNITCTSEDATE